MATKTDPAKLARQARDLIEQLNHVVLNDARALSAPVLSETVQVLKQLVERLPQAFEQTADVLEMLAEQDKVVVDGQDPKAAVAEVAAELRAAGAGSQQLAKELANPASALFLMGGR
ncbi:hypothetical protein RVR_P1125 (plasmid) [Actinacidiphila reveromycinica]|uniref:Uncharacterized protein n=1 Tax=Actinacidiphila reveromycinica TaxID=659352 RepID=A0A7R6T9P9_9ACTN|nr:hypothetical protein [Streptomyces sp. SN-593]BBG20739.1 hypothetical protein RVR_P1125 [Streptomyces sp. SN-593]